MLVEAIKQSLPFAFGIALSPLPIAAIIMILMSARARTNAPAFLLGWFLGLLLVLPLLGHATWHIYDQIKVTPAA